MFVARGAFKSIFSWFIRFHFFWFDLSPILLFKFYYKTHQAPKKRKKINFHNRELHTVLLKSARWQISFCFLTRIFSFIHCVPLFTHSYLVQIKIHRGYLQTDGRGPISAFLFNFQAQKLLFFFRTRTRYRLHASWKQTGNATLRLTCNIIW